MHHLHYFTLIILIIIVKLLDQLREPNPGPLICQASWPNVTPNKDSPMSFSNLEVDPTVLFIGINKKGL